MSCEIKVHDPAPLWSSEVPLEEAKKLWKSTLWHDLALSDQHMLREYLDWEERQDRERALYYKLRAKFSPS